LSLVRFYLQMELYPAAEAELEGMLKAFPERRDEYERTLREIKQLMARRVLDEIRARRTAGQHLLAYSLLKNFPTKGVAGAILADVQAILEEYDGLLKQRVEILDKLDAQIKQLAAAESQIPSGKTGPQHPGRAARLEAIRQEILAELSVQTLDRMAPYRELSGDPDASLEQKVALAISGWTQGAKGATNNLAVALSLYQVRDLVYDYFQAEIKLDREAILEKCRREEGGSPERLAALLAHMKPPKRTPEQANGFYELTVTGAEAGAPVTYYVQLPPEYHPYRRYPVVVTLNGGSTTPKQQVDWWAGGVDAQGNRRGQGTRQGYIVIAPTWAEKHQRKYDYSLREHAAVLNSLRDACRRFSIDTDRVFLSGHAMGGTAAWDIGLAHPDLFAGIIPIATKIDRYCDLYWENARQLPIYYVVGQMDGDKLSACAMSLDRYMLRAYPVVVSEFVGRGHEDFSDEQLRLFDWMSRQRRDFARKDFQNVTLRPWDNFFWWIEMEGMPAPSMILPEDWEKSKRRNLFRVTGKVVVNNGIIISGGAKRVTVWLTPAPAHRDRSRQELSPQRHPAIDRGAARGRPHPRRPPTPLLGQGGRQRRHPGLTD